MKLGFIGVGSMSGAIVKGLLKSGFNPADIYIYTPNQQKQSDLVAEFGVNGASSDLDCAEQADYVFFGMKPHMYDDCLAKVKPALANGKITVMMAAGYTVAHAEKVLGSDCKIIRTMPNTPLLIGEGVIALCKNAATSAEEVAYLINWFEKLGDVYDVEEKMIDLISGISGSGPTYTYLFIEALSDAAVLNGIPRELSYKLASKTVLGAAKMVLETGEHPGVLKDKVTSPGGTTIEAVKSLESDGFRGTVINAVDVCIAKNLAMKNAK